MHWIFFTIILIILPFIYKFIRTSGGDYIHWGFDEMFILLSCWIAAIIFSICSLFPN